MDVLPHRVANRLISGGTYARLGLGLTTIVGRMNVVAFAHGECYTLVACAALFVLSALAPKLLLAVLGTLFAAAMLEEGSGRAAPRPEHGYSAEHVRLQGEARASRGGPRRLPGAPGGYWCPVRAEHAGYCADR